jgi:hypothetical protein
MMSIKQLAADIFSRDEFNLSLLATACHGNGARNALTWRLLRHEIRGIEELSVAVAIESKESRESLRRFDSRFDA